MMELFEQMAPREQRDPTAPIDLEALRMVALAAQEACPGPWVFGPYAQMWVGIQNDWGKWGEVSPGSARIIMSLHIEGDEPIGNFAQAAQPSVLLELLDRLQAAEAALGAVPT